MNTCVFCQREADYKQSYKVGRNKKVSYYCKGHKKEGIAFGFLEETELTKIE